MKGGIKEAAQLLASLSKTARDKVFAIMLKQNPKMAEMIYSQMYNFEDLKYLTPLMIQVLVKKIKAQDLALSLRISSPELREHILSNIPKVIRQEIEELLIGPPKLTSHIEEAQARIMSFVRDGVEKGQFVINKEKSEKSV